mmetsp:Transcript_38875/g.48132  ORF Transcript_38875/g.48132 Transcript_38875/m.48132 type:complete len:112 (+) Transcript_38875:101-436(+)
MLHTNVNPTNKKGLPPPPASPIKLDHLTGISDPTVTSTFNHSYYNSGSSFSNPQLNTPSKTHSNDNNYGYQLSSNYGSHLNLVTPSVSSIQSSVNASSYGYQTYFNAINKQ